MKQTLVCALIAAAAMTITTPEAEAQDFKVTGKFSGYVMTQYQATFREGNNSNSFNLRMARLSLAGNIGSDFGYKIQGQINGNTTTLGDSPRLIDAFAEWKRYDFVKIKAGQFKRPFTFENPMAPIDQGFMGYSQNVLKLAGFSDRAGDQASNGRDIGLQVEGDLLADAGGHHWLHYQAGVFNGQGINQKDVDNRKDIIGGIWISPVEGLRIGAFGWNGTKARNGSWQDSDGQQHQGVRSLEQNRYALSAEYKKGDWQVRSEYVHSTGEAFKTTIQSKTQMSDANVNTALGNKADGWYALAIVPVIKEKLRVKARYDLYRPAADWQKSRTQYEVGLNWLVNRNVILLTEYALINDRTLAKHNYSMADVELCVKF